MNGCFSGGLNGFCRSRSQCRRPAPIPVPMLPGPPGPAGPAGGLAAFGSIYQYGEKRFSVVFPGDVVPITFSDNAMLSRSMAHTPETADVGVGMPGVYEIAFTLYVTASATAPATFAIQKNAESIEGGVFSQMLSTGLQTVTGSTMVFCEHRDIVRLVFTAPSALSATLTGANVSGTLIVKKLD